MRVLCRIHDLDDQTAGCLRRIFDGAGGEGNRALGLEVVQWLLVLKTTLLWCARKTTSQRGRGGGLGQGGEERSMTGRGRVRPTAVDGYMWVNCTNFWLLLNLLDGID